jgi:hypothetical protein
MGSYTTGDSLCDASPCSSSCSLLPTGNQVANTVVELGIAGNESIEFAIDCSVEPLLGLSYCIQPLPFWRPCPNFLADPTFHF